MPYQVKEHNAYRFAASSVERAQRVILTPTKTVSSETRWERETDATASFLKRVIPRGVRVFDYGCGVGRISKALLDRRPDLEVVGIETSPDMRTLAPGYVGHPGRFSVLETLKDLPQGHFGFGFAIYALQHVGSRRLESDLPLIDRTLAGDGGFYLLDAVRRCVPEKSMIERMALQQRRPDLDLVVDQIAREIFPHEKRWRWNDDGLKIPKLLAPLFARSLPVPLPPDSFAPEIITGHHSILFERS